MKLKLTFIAFFTAIGFSGFAQQSEKAALETGAPAATAFSVTDSSAMQKAESKTVVKVAQKPTFSLAAGTMFSNYGMATYLAPSMYYRLNSKFSVFTGLTYLNTSFNPTGSDRLQPMATKHYLVHVGGAYDVNDKLRISGSVWRDFSDMTSQFGNANNLRQPARYGTEFNATYKVNDVLSIHGGIRTSNGNSYNHYNGLNSSFHPASPFGY